MSNFNKDMAILVASADKEATIEIIKSLKSLEFRKISHIDDGVTLVKRLNEEKFDFIIFDVNIKLISGWLLIKEVKTSEQLPNIPVILFGRGAAPASEAELKNYGVVKYLKFPTSASDISFSINSTLQLFNTSGTIENKYTKAKTALLNNDAEKAVEMYSELRGLTTKSSRSSIGLAQAHIKNEESDKARQIMIEVASSGDESPASLLITARLEFEGEKAENACSQLKKIVTIVPNGFYYNEVVKLAFQFKQLDLARSLSEEAISKDFKLPEFLLTISKCQYAQGQFDDCIASAKKAEAEFGVSNEILNLKGVCYKKLNRFGDAILCYEEALRLSPTDAKVYFNLALCAIDMGDFIQAARYLGTCLEIAPQFQRAIDKLNELKEKRAV